MTRRVGVLLSALAVSAIYSLPANGQNVISARSGLIHYIEGDVTLDGKAVALKASQFPEVKEKSELRTVAGRAEVLLNPGVFLRIGENSAFRMVDSRLTHSVVEFLTGSAVVEANDELKGDESSVTIVYRGNSIELQKGGIYRLDSEPSQLRVYQGEAAVKAGDDLILVKKGRLLPFDGAMVAEKFDAKEGDALGRWSRRRAEYVAMANLSGAKRLRDSGMSWARSGWYFNPYFGMMTYIPMSGMYMSPYGFGYYSPRTIYRIYEPPVMRGPSFPDSGFGSGMGRVMSQTSRGQSGVMSSAPPSVSAPTSSASGAASAPVSRSGAGGGRGR